MFQNGVQHAQGPSVLRLVQIGVFSALCADEPTHEESDEIMFMMLVDYQMRNLKDIARRGLSDWPYRRCYRLQEPNNNVIRGKEQSNRPPGLSSFILLLPSLFTTMREILLLL